LVSESESFRFKVDLLFAVSRPFLFLNTNVGEKMKKALCIIGLCLAVVSVTSAQNAQRRLVTLNLRDYFDYAVFKHKEDAYVEFYSAVPKQILKFVVKGGQLESQIEVTITATAKVDTAFKREAKSIFSTIAADSSKAINGQTLNIAAMILKKGDYMLNFKLKDLNNPVRTIEFEQPLTVSAFDENKIQLSDIEVAYRIESSKNTEGRFYKNTLEVIPNPTSYFKSSDTLKYYIEIYNVKSPELVGDYFYTHTYLSAADKKPIEGTEKRKREKRTSASLVKYETVMLADQSGVCYLNYEITDSAFNVIAAKSKKLFVFNPDKKAEPSATIAQQDFNKSDYAKLSEDEADNLIAKMGYIMNKAEKGAAENASTLEEKQRFIFNFWAVRDELARREYLQLIAQADQEYSGMYKKGWQTDRGRVLAVYGRPSSIDRYSSSDQSKPYEIWTYDVMKGQQSSIFVFADRSGYGLYELIHSTARGELSNPDWQRLINGTVNTGNGNVSSPF
jgi:GWxTD domain-containing protein